MALSRKIQIFPDEDNQFALDLGKQEPIMLSIPNNVFPLEVERDVESVWFALVDSSGLMLVSSDGATYSMI